MKRYVFSLFFVVAVSFMLLVSLGYAREEGGGASGPRSQSKSTSKAFTFTPSDGIANFDGADIWRAKCVNNLNKIRADVYTFGTFGDNNYYVNTVCTNGKGDTEAAFGSLGYNLSSLASTPNNCRQATILYHCDLGYCDELWTSLIECVGRGFDVGFPKKSQDVD